MRKALFLICCLFFIISIYPYKTKPDTSRFIPKLENIDIFATETTLLFQKQFYDGFEAFEFVDNTLLNTQSYHPVNTIMKSFNITVKKVNFKNIIISLAATTQNNNVSAVDSLIINRSNELIKKMQIVTEFFPCDVGSMILADDNKHLVFIIGFVEKTNK